MSLDNLRPAGDIVQAEHENSANAMRVIIVNGNGNIIKASQQEENRLGSDCSGNDGDINRILTLQNTSESGSPVSVWVDTQLIAQIDLTIVHNSINSEITLKVNIYNSQSIRVLYYI